MGRTVFESSAAAGRRRRCVPALTPRGSSAKFSAASSCWMDGCERRSVRRRSSSVSSRPAPASVRAATVEHDLHPGLAHELARQMPAELGMVLRHDEEVARHCGILPQRVQGSLDSAPIGRGSGVREGRNYSTDCLRMVSKTSRGRRRNVSTTRGSKWVPAQRLSSAWRRRRGWPWSTGGRRSWRRRRRPPRRCARRAGCPRPRAPAGSRCRPTSRGGRRRWAPRRAGTGSARSSRRPISGWVRMIAPLRRG